MQAIILARSRPASRKPLVATRRRNPDRSRTATPQPSWAEPKVLRPPVSTPSPEQRPRPPAYSLYASRSPLISLRTINEEVDRPHGGPNIRKSRPVGPSQTTSLRGGEMARPGRSQFFLFYFTSLRGRLDYQPWPTSRKTVPKAPRMAVKPFLKGSYRPSACWSTPDLPVAGALSRQRPWRTL
jgi:hypothetical protein